MVIAIMVLELGLIQTKPLMLGNGKTDLKKERELKLGLMDIFTTANLMTVNGMVKEL